MADPQAQPGPAVGQPVPHESAALHVTGAAVFTGDLVGRLDGERFVVLSHAPDEHAVQDFATRISTAVRELGLHHPRSRAGRFVTVSFRVGLVRVAEESQSAGKFLDDLLAGLAD